MKVYDFIIIGGGPAGSTAAALLGRDGFDVLVLEKEKFPRFHVGESLLPFCYDIFKNLGVLDLMEKQFARKPGVTFSNIDNTQSSNWCFSHLIPDDSYLSFHVERDRFDKMLLDNSRQMGAEVREEVKVKHIDFSEKSHVKVISDKEETFLGEFILDASGQDAFLGRFLANKRKQPNLSQRIALSTHWKNPNLDSTLKTGNLRIVSLEGEKKGWIWMIPVSEEKLSVGVVIELDYFKKQKRNKAIANSDWLKEIYLEEVYSCFLGKSVLETAQMTMDVAVNSDYSFDVSRKFGERYAIIGDAASFLDPMFASGVYVAMKSAVLVTEALIEMKKVRNDLPLHNAYSQIAGAYELLEVMIKTFYNPEAIKFSELGQTSVSEYKKLDTVFGLMHLILAGDFFSEHRKYLDAISILNSEKMVDRFKNLARHTNKQTSKSCHQKKNG